MQNIRGYYDRRKIVVNLGCNILPIFGVDTKPRQLQNRDITKPRILQNRDIIKDQHSKSLNARRSWPQSSAPWPA